MEETGSLSGPLPDLSQEMHRVLAAAGQQQVPLRLVGGLAVRWTCPIAESPPLSREYADADLVCYSKDRRRVGGLLEACGYMPDKRFNSLHGHQRLYFHDPQNDRHVDVFIDAVRMCHRLELKNRLELVPDTITPTDLLLTKLQVVQLNEKDLLDLLALLHDKEVTLGDESQLDGEYLGHLWGTDWGWWKTSEVTLHRLASGVTHVLKEPSSRVVSERIAELQTILAICNKSLGWRARAWVGERWTWYETPEEIAR